MRRSQTDAESGTVRVKVRLENSASVHRSGERCTLELSSGRKESYDVGLMLKNPWLTAFEIGRFLGRVA